MEIQTEIKGSKGSFYYEEDGRRLAQSTFSFAGEDKIIVDHTEVDDSLRGKGVGMELIRTAVAFAREKGIRIMPLCPFFKAGFEKHPEFSDVLL